jgi:hypothetical protein
VARRSRSVRIALGVATLLATVAFSAVTNKLIMGGSLASGALDFLMFAVLVWPLMWWFERRRRNEP